MNTRRIQEGKAAISISDGVFYNPEMSELRDISVLFLRALGIKGKRILDATAATGIRAIRYGLEAKAKDVTALDMNAAAARLAKRNVRTNGLGFEVIDMSLQEFANVSRKRFDIIDFDPFGSPAPGINDLMKISGDGTVLMITATDTAVLCGAHEAACVKVYGAKPLHNEMCKEAGIRILIAYIARIAAGFNFGTQALLSISDKHYMRVFLRLQYGAKNAAASMKETGLGAFCRHCYSFRFGGGPAPLISPKCPKCKGSSEAFGPLWLGRLRDKKFIETMIKLEDAPLVSQALEEPDTVMLFSIPHITEKLGFSSVSKYRVIELLRAEGYIATKTQFNKEGIKTDADIGEVIRAVKKARK